MWTKISEFISQSCIVVIQQMLFLQYFITIEIYNLSLYVSCLLFYANKAFMKYILYLIHYEIIDPFHVRCSLLIFLGIVTGEYFGSNISEWRCQISRFLFQVVLSWLLLLLSCLAIFWKTNCVLLTLGLLKTGQHVFHGVPLMDWLT